MFLLALGLVLTVAWLWVGWYYVAVYFGQENIFYLLPAELGLFLLGFFAPLGLFWLMVSQSSLRRRLIRLERQIAALTMPPDEIFPEEMRTDEEETPDGAASDRTRREPRFDAGAEEADLEEDVTADTGRPVAAPPPKSPNPATDGTPQHTPQGSGASDDKTRG
ncbi:hypothetical protein [Algihabitans albus]|uniref:hypothetical protein n=1 Tax=Algihabitans albus TaxID=2164067 RepID=UPI000E5C9108|nr:hypothetical protein [Algihabitans albus]